jgi:very-short-patch-repair endonuclease
MDHDDLAMIGRRQYGLFTLDQAERCGLNRTTVYRRAGNGHYRTVRPAVFVFVGAPDSWEQRLLAACLAAGQDAVASHRAAARIWRLVDRSDDTVEISVPRQQRPRLPTVTVHRSMDLVHEHSTVRHRIPVTNPLRTIVDLAAVLPADRVEDAVDAGLAHPCLFSVPAVEWMLNELAGRGRRGAGVLRDVLAERVLGDALSDSVLESRMARLLRRAGLPPATFHYVIRTPAGVLLAEVDFAYPEARLAIEVDGFAVHGTPRRMAKDFVRQNGLVPYDWHVLRFTWRQVVRQPDMIVRAVAAALAGLAAA